MIRLHTRRIVLFGLCLIAALLLFLPLRLVAGAVRLGDMGFTAREARGSIWAGRLYEARFGAVSLGDLHASLSPLQLLAGRARLDLRGRGADAIRGAVSVSRHEIGVDDVTASVAAGTVFAPLPIAALDLDDVSVRFRDGACDAADGHVHAAVTGDLAGIALGQGLSGDVRCDGTALLIPLASQAGTETVALRLSADGSYTAILTVQPADDAGAQALERRGFTRQGAGEVLQVTGSL